MTRINASVESEKPGLFYKAFHRIPDASALNSVMIGDSISDIEVARKLGIRAILSKVIRESCALDLKSRKCLPTL